MKRLFNLLLLVAGFFLAATAYAQEPTVPAVNTFSTNLTAIALPGGQSTVAGTLAGVSLGITQNLSVHQTNLIAPGNVSGFYGGIGYQFAPFSKLLNNKSPQLNGYDFRLQLTGSVGVNRVSDRQHYSGLATARLSYAIHGSNTWGVAVEAGAIRLPGYAKGWQPIVALGPKITF